MAGYWRGELEDIDTLAVAGEVDGARLVMAGCKRGPDKHRTRWLVEQFGEFLDTLDRVANEKAARLRALSRRRLVLLPQFGCRNRVRFAGEGFEIFDIRDMAGGANAATSVALGIVLIWISWITPSRVVRTFPLRAMRRFFVKSLLIAQMKSELLL